MVDIRYHATITGGALKRWLVAQFYDSVAVAGLWLVGLLIVGVPWAVLWAFIAGLLQFVPHFGPVLTLVLVAVVTALTRGFEPMLWTFIVYAVIVAVDGLVLQPVIMKRTARIPVWASILTPLVLGFFFSFWGVLLSAPLLAVYYAYRSRSRHPEQPDVEILPPGSRAGR